MHGQGEQETLHIVVRPRQWWPTDYVYVIGLTGIGLRVWNTEGADLLPHEQHDFDEMAVHHFFFSPQQAHPNFGFNVDGVDVILVSLTCGLPHAPPSPPLQSPPPPLPSPQFALPFSLGLRSLSSRLAVGVLVLLVMGRLLACYLQSSGGRALRRGCFGETRRSVISAAEVDAADAAQPNGDADGFWSVLFDVGGQDIEMPLQQTIATDVTELKQALAELASEALGPKKTPSAWMRDELGSLRVQYVDSDERPLTVSHRTPFSDVIASPYLRVTESSGAPGARGTRQA